MKREFQIGFLKRHALLPTDYLLDLGCGTLRGGIPIIEYLDVGHYYGIEVRPEVLKEARGELSEAGLEGKEPRLITSPSLTNLDLGTQFEVIWAFAVIIHMTDDKLDEALGFVARHLRPDGVFFATANVGSFPDRGWQGFPVVTRSLAFYASACDRHGLVVEDMAPLRALGHISNTLRQRIRRLAWWLRGMRRGPSPDDQRMLRITHPLA